MISLVADKALLDRLEQLVVDYGWEKVAEGLVEFVPPWRVQVSNGFQDWSTITFGMGGLNA